MKYTIVFLNCFLVLCGNTQEAHLVIPKGHLEGISTVVCSPDGKYILSAGKDHAAIVWDPHGLEIESLKLSHAVTGAIFSPDGKLILTGSSEGNINLWKFNGEHLLVIKAHLKSIQAVAFSPDGNTILSGGLDNVAHLWNLNGKLLKTLKHTKSVNTVAFSGDGKFIFTGSSDRTVVKWDLKGKKLQTFIGHKRAIKHLSVSVDGKYLVTAGEDSIAILWNTDGSILHVIQHPGRVNSCDFSPDNLTIASGCNDGLVKIWNLSGDILSEFKAHEWGLTSLCFSPDGKAILSSSDDKTMHLFDLKGNRLQNFSGHSHDIHSVKFSPDGNFILTGTGDHTAKLWDLLNYRYQSFSGHKDKIITSCFSPDGKFVLTSSQDKTAKLWSLNGKVLITFSLPEELFTASFSPDGKTILTSCTKGITKLWNISGKELAVIKQHEKITAAEFLPDGKSLVTVSQEGIIKQFNLKGKLNFTNHFSGSINCIVIVSDSNQIILGDKNGQVMKWNYKNNEILRNYGKVGDEILSLAVSKNEDFVASGNVDGKIGLWTRTDTIPKYFTGHTAKVFSLDFSPDSKFLISCSEDETTRLWNISTGKELVCMISLDSIDWVVTSPNGLFDASSGAMIHMDYVVGFETIELDQLKERYYEPGLLEEVFGVIETEYHDVPALKNIALYPELEGKIQKDQLHIQLKERSGGIGKLSVFVNHKEVTEDANPDRKTELKLNLNNYNKYFYGDTNLVTLRVYNQEGWLESHAHNYYFLPYEGSKGSTDGGASSRPIIHKGKPHLYALVVGTSDYSGEALDLRFPDLDAAAIAHGLQAVGSRLFDDRVHIRLLSTTGKIQQDISSKINIQNELKIIAEKATPGDIVIAYFSGHGTTYGQAEKNQFYYLTKDIATENLSDPEVRNNYTVSSNELTQWLTAITSHKEVLIFDACHSGKAVEVLSGMGAKDLSPSQIRALDRMKDRSGIFIISGSAADQVSYEASQYGQGLLTYSLLQGMSGLAVTEDNRVDLAQLFEYARDKVPEFAKSINKVQIPIVAFPHGGGSFDIGIVDSTVKIKLAQPKPVFIRNIFLDGTNMSDHLNITHTLAEYFRSITSQGAEADLIYVDVNDYESAHSIKGIYTVTSNEINLKARLFFGKTSLGEFQLVGSKADIPGMVDKIMEKVEPLIKR